MRYKVQNQAGEVYKAENIELDSNFVTMRFWNSEDRVSINDILSIKRSYPEAEKHTASELNAKYSIKTKDGNTHNASDYEYIHGLIVIKFHYGELWLPKMNILSVQGEYPSSKIPSNLELNYKVIVEGGNVYQASDVEVAFGLIRIKFDNDELKLPLGSILSIQKAYSKAEIAANKSEKLSPRVMVETKSDRVYKAFDVEVGFGFVTIKLLEYELQLPAGEILSTRKTYLKSDTVVEKKSGELRSTIIKTKTGKTYKARGVEVAFGFVTMKFWNGELRLQAGEILSITKTYLTDDLAPIVRTKLRYTVKTKTGKEYKARGGWNCYGFCNDEVLDW